MSWHENKPHWRARGRQHGRRMFFRFLMAFGMIVGLIVGGMGLLAALLTTWAGGDSSVRVLVWIGGIVLLIGFPLLAIRLAIRAFRTIAVPLTEVMEAAEAVSKGDLSVRVEEPSRGEFGGLARSFNHMVSELSLADERRRNLTADIAHELRTPLHIIQGKLEGVIDGVYEATSDHLESTLEETRLLARLIEDLRILSLAEAGQLPLREEIIDAATLLDDVATSFSGQAAAAGVNLVVDAPAALFARGDTDRLLQVLNNLVVNALRHTPAGGSVTLGAGPHEDGVCLIITDTGEGIAAADLPFVFDRFWRGDKARGHHAGSTGLGLAIAQQLVKAMGGTITVRSKVGQGSTFVVEMPKSKLASPSR